ncbi:MAG: hypothetical protein LBV80_06190 [Deltaproteobacteria bacterium]|jgi:hypothetical protein|nr:hypothetical protein [Deltaproteobacteria bacterium]
MLHGETLHSMLPQDIPWWMPDHVIFFGVLYAVLITLGIGLGVVAVKTLRETMAEYNMQSQDNH